MLRQLPLVAAMVCGGDGALCGQPEMTGPVRTQAAAHPWNQLSTLVPFRPLNPPLKSLGEPKSGSANERIKGNLTQRLPPTTETLQKTIPKSDPSSIAASPAAANSAWHLATLESIALQHNPALQRAAANVSAAHGRALQVGLKPNPLMGIDYQQVGSRGLAEQFGATLQQEFVVPEKLELNRQVAYQDIQRLQHEFAIQRQRVLTDVRIAFVRALKAQKQLEFLQQLVSLSDQARVISEKLLEAEEVGKTDLLQAEVEVERAKVERANVLNHRQAVWRELASVVGQPELPFYPLAGDLKGPAAERDFEQTLSQLRSCSPEIAALAATIQRARYNLRRQEVEPRPNITVQGLMNWQDNGIGGSSDGALTVSLPIPVWDRNQGAVQAAYQELMAADRQFKMLELQLQQRLAGVYERYRNALQQISQFEQVILPKAAEVLTLTRKAYEIGELDFVSLLTAQRSYAQFQLTYLDALEELRIAEFEMEGLLLSGSLQN